jgi:hypothetical protein
MNAADALKTARAAGVEVLLDGDDLALNAASAPPAAVLDALSLHKAEVVALLRPGRDGRSAEEVLFDERAGIIEFDGGLPRAWAEALARLDPTKPPGDVPARRWVQFIDDCGPVFR